MILKNWKNLQKQLSNFKGDKMKSLLKIITFGEKKHHRDFLSFSRFLIFRLLFCSILGVFSASAYTPERTFTTGQVPEELKGLEIEEKMGASLDLQLEFVNDQGKKVKLAEYFNNNQPVLFSIIYYSCPNLCGLHLNGLSKALKDLSEDFRKRFNFILLSMDATEKPSLALEKKKHYMKKYSLPEERTHFLTGSKENILALSNQFGFRFRWDDDQKIFAHLPVGYILTPEGKISRYLYGVTFQAQTLRLSLVEASKGKIGSIVDRVLLFCFQFDPKRGRYSWYAYNIMRAGGFFTVFLLLFFLLPVWLKENKKLRGEKS